MALGTITVTSQPVKAASQPLQVALISMPGDGAYATGGTAFQAAVRLALGRQVTILAVISAGGNGGFVPIFDVANDKLMVYQGDNDGVADGPLAEVPATTDLSTTTFKLQVLCY